MQAYEDAREAARDHAREATEMLQEKNREVEWLRAQKAADDVSGPRGDGLGGCGRRG